MKQKKKIPEIGKAYRLSHRVWLRPHHFVEGEPPYQVDSGSLVIFMGSHASNRRVVQVIFGELVGWFTIPIWIKKKHQFWRTVK